MSKSGMERDAVNIAVGGEIHLVRDLLDDQLVDRHRMPMGRADGIILAVPEGGQPRVASIESGITVASGRVGQGLGRGVSVVARRWGIRRGVPVRIAWPKVLRVGIETVLDLD